MPFRGLVRRNATFLKHITSGDRCSLTEFGFPPINAKLRYRTIFLGSCWKSNHTLIRHLSTQRGNADGRDVNNVQGVIVSRDAASTNTNELLSRIPPARQVHPRSVIILLSKSFSSWVDDSGEFIQKTLLRLFPWMIPDANQQNAVLTGTIDVLTAVVDGIPSKQPVHDATGNLDTPNGHTAVSGSESLSNDHQNAFDGMAYWVSDTTGIFEATGNVDETAQRPSVGDSGKAYTVQFNIVDSQDDQAQVFPSIKLPLANTLFHNGRPYTSTISRWHEQNLLRQPPLTNQIQVANIAVNLPVTLGQTNDHVIDSGGNSNFGHIIRMPVLPLTYPRRIQNSKGNVINQFGESENSTMPASLELETAVATYFKEFNITPQPVSVWAIIIPKDLAEKAPSLLESIKPYAAESSYASNNEISKPMELNNKVPFEALLKGAKIRKVFSGGGGWGHKAGLLSVDSADDYEDEKRQFTDLDSDDDLVDFPFFRDIVSQGDYMAFYIVPPTSAIPKIEDAPGFMDQNDHINPTVSIDFGVMPIISDDDDSPAKSTERNRWPKLEYFENHFGALSEVGMVYHLSTSGNRALQHKTKIDIPFARFTHTHVQK